MKPSLLAVRAAEYVVVSAVALVFLIVAIWIVVALVLAAKRQNSPSAARAT